MRGTLTTFASLIKHGFHQGGLACINAVLPPTCSVCQQRVPGGNTLETGCCPACYGALPWWNPAMVMPPLAPPNVASFAAPLLYRDSAREVIQRFKFSDATPLARPLARFLAPMLDEFGPDSLLVPVPLHRKKLRQRFYNQSALLARELGKLSGLPVAIDGLERLVYAAPQAQRTRAQRQQLPGTHFAAKSVVEGRIVVLVDDILTTGSTARACALALRRAGAAQIHVRTLAYTPPG